MVKTSVIIRVGKPEIMVIKMVILGMILFDEKRRTVASMFSSPAHCWRHPGLVRHRFCTRNALPKDGYLDIWISGKGFILIPLSRSGHHLCVYAPQMDEPGLLFCSRPKDSWGFPRFQPDRGQ